MDNIKAIELLEYIKTFDDVGFGATRIALDKGIEAIKRLEKLQKMVETLENNLSQANKTVLNDYEIYKYQAHCQCLTHLKEILNQTDF